MDKRTLLLNSALKLFVDNGFHGTATSKIAQEAGVANGTLFQYFRTKDELVIALYIHLKEELGEFIKIHTQNDTAYKEEMKSQILSSLYWALENPSKFRFIEQFHTSPYIGQVEKEVIQGQVKPHLELIQKGIEQEIIKSLPSDLIYTLLSNQVFGCYHYLIASPITKSKQEEIIELTFEMLWEMVSLK